MAGAVGAAARGAMEAGERGGRSAASRFSRGAGRGRGPCSFSQEEGGGRGGRPTLLSPAEQVFAAVRRWVEGRRYERIEAKKVAVEGGAARVGGWGEGLIAGRVALHPSSFECPAFMIKKLCI